MLAQEGIADPADLRTNTRAARFAPGTHREAGPSAYAADGLPLADERRQFTWDAAGRLLEVREEGKSLARYAYNHRGERIGKSVGGRTTHFLYEDRQLQAELDARGRMTRLYLSLADRPIAVVDTPAGTPLAEDVPAWRQALADLATILAGFFGQRETTVWLHADHLGAPVAATGAAGPVLWRAGYAPFGAATVTENGFALNLRRPGQYADAETGFYYNGQRYYDPQRGSYLSPDPLGAPDGPNPYAYVRHNPLRFVDPDGLILFAFDGTGNDESDPDTLSNVVRFRDLYASDDGINYYITGPGTLDPRSGIKNPIYLGGNPLDIAKSLTGKKRIARLIQDLKNYSDNADDDKAVDIDIVGFSRGAAEARDFANQIVSATTNGWYKYNTQEDEHGHSETKCQKVNFRFMGLFDTVLSTHTDSYALGIPGEFAYVAQAVALNEYRGNLPAFPAESILQGPFSAVPVEGKTRIEMGFLGAHSDIGGGFEEGDLSKVALAWMVEQATAAGVSMKEPPASITSIIANPVIHDSSSNLLHGAPEGGPTASSEDREFRYQGGATVRQRQAVVDGMSYPDTEQFITYKSDPNGFDSISGTVDAQAYLNWLNAHGYGINMTVQ